MTPGKNSWTLNLQALRRWRLVVGIERVSSVFSWLSARRRLDGDGRFGTQMRWED